MVLDTHRWVPLPTVGFTSNGQREESQDDVSPPSLLMEYPPLAVFVNGNIFITIYCLPGVIFPYLLNS